MNIKLSMPIAPATPSSDIAFEMVVFDALSQIHKLTGYDKEQMLLALIRVAQEGLIENVHFH